MNIPPTSTASVPASEQPPGAADLLPLNGRSIPPTGSNEQRDATPGAMPGFSSSTTPPLLPPRPQNSGASSPFNPATDIFETSTFNIGDIGVTTRYTSPSLFNQGIDRGTQPLSPAGLSANPVRVDLNAPIVKEGAFALDAKARLDSNQTYRIGAEASVNLGNLRLSAGVFESQPIQSVFENDGLARTELNAAASLRVSDTLGLGIGVSRTTGGSPSQSGITRVEPNVSLNIDGTQVQAGAALTFDDVRGNTQLGATLTIQPAKPDNTRPYGFAVVKIGDNPLTDNSASFSVNGGIRF